MSVRRITTAVALLGAGLASQVSAAGTTTTKDPVVVKAVVPTAAATPAVAAAPTGPVGKVEIKETIFDAGSVDRGSDVSHSFMLKNIGLGDLTIEAKPG